MPPCSYYAIYSCPCKMNFPELLKDRKGTSGSHTRCWLWWYPLHQSMTSNLLRALQTLFGLKLHPQRFYAGMGDEFFCHNQGLSIVPGCGGHELSARCHGIEGLVAAWISSV